MLMTNAALEAVDAGPLQVAALHDDHRVAGIVDAVGDDRCRATPGSASSGGGGRSRLTTRTSLPSCAQREGHRQRRTDGVAVGPRVRGDDEPLARGGSRRQSRPASRSSLGLGVVPRASALRLARRRRVPLPRAGRAGSARCGPGGRSTRRTGSRARGRGAAGWRCRSGGGGTASRARAPCAVSARALASPSVV